MNLNSANEQLDAFLIKNKLKSEPIHIFVKEIPQFTQEVTLNLNCGVTLENAITTTINTHRKDLAYSELDKLCLVYKNAITALNIFALSVKNTDMWRLTRLFNQIQSTGSYVTITALEQFYNDIWNQQLEAAKMKSEKITLMLTFLLMLSFISVIIVIVAPIILTI